LAQIGVAGDKVDELEDFVRDEDQKKFIRFGLARTSMTNRHAPGRFAAIFTFSNTINNNDLGSNRSQRTSAMSLSL
jgi:hypothetical protein